MRLQGRVAIVTGGWNGIGRAYALGLGHGRNHGAPARLERAALRWAIYRNFTPAQERRERQRHYHSAGLSPLARAGVPPGAVSYLDALAI